MWYIIGILLAVFVLVLLKKPRDRGGGHDEYFTAAQKALKEDSDGTPKIICDLDRLDRNISRVMETVGESGRIRIVTKSLPCMELIKYIMEKTGSRKLMSFHVPFLPMILAELGYDIDVLFGKPVPARAAGNFFQSLPARKQAAGTIQWLVDTPERLAEYRQLAKSLSLRLRVNIELDIGLNRGGIRDIETLRVMLEEIRSFPEHLEFSGFMGYEGHVPHVPALFSREKAVRRALDKTMERYRKSCQYLDDNFSDILPGECTYNSGGSGTFRFYTGSHPARGLAMGGAFLRPASYPAVSLPDLEPAIFIAAPVIKKTGPLKIPFVEFLTPFLAWWNPNFRRSFSVYGGGWAGRFASPPGIDPLEMLNDPPNQNLLPNQSVVSGSDRVSLEVGDYVFYWPQQSDAMFQFNTILTTRGGRITGEWKTFPFGY